MNKVKRIFFVVLLTIVVSLFSGCTDILNTSSGDVIISSASSNSGWSVQMGYYVTATFIIENIGDQSVENIQLDIKAEDQNGNLEFNNVVFVTSTLASGESITESVTIDYQMGDSLLKADVTLKWNGGSRDYEYQWNLS